MFFNIRHHLFHIFKYGNALSGINPRDGVIEFYKDLVLNALKTLYLNSGVHLTIYDATKTLTQQSQSEFQKIMKSNHEHVANIAKNILFLFDKNFLSWTNI
jgi:hypothetical protein